jgi:poly-gamma-glutamate synthesis protein (capsule biosynthesis protein)
VKIALCGDALFSSRNLLKRFEQTLLDMLGQADVRFVNAEFCTPKRKTPPAAGRGYTTSVREETLDELKDLGFDLVAFANNHTGDYGSAGVIDTLEAAEKRGLIPCGIGRSLDEARAPAFFDTKKGRVGVVTVCTTRSEVFAASKGGNGVPPRPGLNPLRWKQSYVLPENLYFQLKAIDEALGTRASMAEGLRVETMPAPGEDRFRFGSLYEGNLMIERGERAYVKTHMNERDKEENLRAIRDCKKRADIAIVSIHTHEGVNENWYSEQPAEFVREFARLAIESGADAVVGHGAHFLRAVEIYRGAPIFYNLGSLLMEFEAGESIIPPEMYEDYNLKGDSFPSDLHGNRAKDTNGEFIGFNAEPRFSRGCVAVLDCDGGKIESRLKPVDLRMNSDRTANRGIPVSASHETGEEIAAYLNKIGGEHGAKCRYDREDACIRIAPVQESLRLGRSL